MPDVLPAFARVMEIMAQCEAAAESGDERPGEVELRDGVRLEGVSYSDGGQGTVAAVRDLDLTIRAGETTAIVGPSGAGKSTIADLLMGLVTPTRGSVRIGDAPLVPGLSRSWRSEIGYVAQETFLFNDTVERNLLWACPDAGREEVWRGMNWPPPKDLYRICPKAWGRSGDRGVRLSGGERQRLALARALLRNPSLLILDEATSALDSENERRIQGAIEELHGRMTILVITHRLLMIRQADLIDVVDDGRLVELGDWQRLMAGRWAFRRVGGGPGYRRWERTAPVAETQRSERRLT